MRIIDTTPYQTESGEISLLDQIKARLKYGAGCLEEINAQKTVIAHLENVLDNRYTLLRNVTLAGLGVTIPIILVGPTGIYVIYITPLRGMYRAKGDAFGSLKGYKFIPTGINLLTRTAQMGRAVQVYLERQGYPNSTLVEPVLLATDPGMHIDSIRPIVRVVLSDALERFAVSITQARAIFSAEAVHDILNWITNPHPAPQEQSETPAGQEPPQAPPTEALSARMVAASATIQPDTTTRSRKLSFSTKQWAFLIVFFVVEIIILITFVVLVLSNL